MLLGMVHGDKVDGHFFGTSASNPGGGAGWIRRENVPASYLNTMSTDLVTVVAGLASEITNRVADVDAEEAARGLGSSGAALKGAATFATGLADSNYQTQYANEVANQTNAFNKLYSLVGTGQSSAVGQGQIASGVADNIAGNTIGAGNAQAASTIAGGNAINSGINNAISSNYLNRATNTGGTNSFGPFNSEAYANGLPWSDRRVKENIKYKRIENGIPMFEFNYVWDKAKRYIGVIAQQVKELVPDAVIESDGVYQVDYDKLGIKFREVNYGF